MRTHATGLRPVAAFIAASAKPRQLTGRLGYQPDAGVAGTTPTRRVRSAPRPTGMSGPRLCTDGRRGPFIPQDKPSPRCIGGRPAGTGRGERNSGTLRASGTSQWMSTYGHRWWREELQVEHGHDYYQQSFHAGTLDGRLRAKTSRRGKRRVSPTIRPFDTFPSRVAAVLTAPDSPSRIGQMNWTESRSPRSPTRSRTPPRR